MDEGSLSKPATSLTYPSNIKSIILNERFGDFFKTEFNIISNKTNWAFSDIIGSDIVGNLIN